jgi:hypothetical protein
MHQRSLITNLKFTYKDQRRKLLKLAKYYQHRNDKDGASHVHQYDAYGQKVERWVDGGLGNHYRDVVDNCLNFATDNLKRDVGSRLLVIGPEVNLMQALPEERRSDILRELTENTLEAWFERMNLPTAEYSYVLHESQASETRPDGRLKDAENLSNTYLHSHVVLAATVPGFEQDRQAYKVYDKQISWLHEAGREAMEQIWTRELGAERVAELNAELEARTQRYLELEAEQERQAFKLPELETETPQIEVEEPEQDLGLELE